MDGNKFNLMMVRQTAEELGVKPSLVKKVVDQYCEQIVKVIKKMDIMNLTPESYKELYRRAIYIPKIGRFVMNWKIIEACQNKQKRNRND